MIKETLSLGKIYYVDFNSARKSSSHSEHEPLDLTLTICVISDPNVIGFSFALSDLFYVRTLKVTIKPYDLRLGKLGQFGVTVVLLVS